MHCSAQERTVDATAAAWLGEEGAERTAAAAIRAVVLGEQAMTEG